MSSEDRRSSPTATSSPTPEDDLWTRPAVPVERLAMEREASVKICVDHLGWKPPIVFTCDDCSFAPRCLLAFDAYNTDGDCLLSK